MIRIAGEDNVGIGTDFTQDQDDAFFEYLCLDKGYGWRVTGPLGEVVNPAGMRTIGDFPNLTAAMEHAGWPEAKIRKVMGEKSGSDCRRRPGRAHRRDPAVSAGYRFAADRAAPGHRDHRKQCAISIGGRDSRSPGIIISPKIPDSHPTGLGRAFPGESDALDLDAVSVAVTPPPEAG